MTVLRYESHLPFSPDAVYAWHARPGAFERLVPPWERMHIRREEGDFEHRRVTLDVRIGPVGVRWVAQHQEAEPGRQFVDVMAEGPLRRWRHVHRFIPQDDGCELSDVIEFDAIGARLLERGLRRLFEFRHARTRHDLERHAAWPARRLRVAITGATGTIGRALKAFLTTGGHEVLTVSRGTTGDVPWNPPRGELDAARLEGLDAVVHLAGHNVSQRRWSAAEKRRIVDSRVVGTRLLCQVLARLSQPPKVVVAGSATGWYGDRAEPVDETSSAGAGFLAEVCRQWEAEAIVPGVRVVHLRTGVVLTSLLARLLLPFRLGLGGQLGSGRQMLPWISLDDLVAIIGHAIFTDSLSGPLNAVAPGAVSNADFTRAVGKIVHRPTVMTVPAAAVRAVFGQMGEEVLLSGCAVRPKRLEETGFRFFYPRLEEALRFEVA
ncbi:MAG TPA: TIGR01777 family oxidoreductase [Candidatus Xenobia bacterium]|jgi:hypothetical protein